MRKFFSTAIVLLGCLLLTAIDAGAGQQIGNLRLLRNADRTSNYLRQLPGGVGALTEFSFVGRVGGIAFEAIAKLPAELVGGNFVMDYDKAAPDGKRAVIKVNGSNYTILLFDWQLRPIAEFADSQFTGVVTLFGDGPDRENNYYVDYHPAFFDRLIGLRLLQADMILMDPAELSKMPTDEKGKIALGPGERVADETLRRQAIERVDLIMRNADADSWVLTDVDRSIEAVLRDGSIVVSGMPHYYFWSAQRSDAQTKSIDRAMAVLNHNFGQALLKLGRDKEGLEAIERSVSMAGQLLSPDSKTLAAMKQDFAEIKLLKERRLRTRSQRGEYFQ